MIAWRFSSVEYSKSWIFTAADLLGYRYIGFGATVVLLDGKVSSIRYGIAGELVFDPVIDVVDEETHMWMFKKLFITAWPDYARELAEGCAKLGVPFVNLSEASRAHPDLALGASPRASLCLLKCARSRALLDGRTYFTHEDVQAVALSVRCVLSEIAMNERTSLSPTAWLRA